MIIVPLKNLWLTLNFATDVLTKGKFVRKHLFPIEPWVESRKKSAVTLLELAKRCLKNADIPDVRKSTRCRILRNVAKCGKPEVHPALKDVHKKRRMEWAKNHMKVNFQTVLFTDECRTDPWWTRWMEERMVLQRGSTSPPDQASARRWWCDVSGGNHWKRAGRTIQSCRWSENDCQTLHWLH